MRHFIVFIALLGLFACNHKEKNPLPLNVQSNSGITIIDSTYARGVYLQPVKKPEPFLPIFYIGAIHDTFRLPEEQLTTSPSQEKSKYIIDSNQFRIVVIPAFDLAVKTTLQKQGTSATNPPDSIVYYKSFVVLMINKSDQPVSLGYLKTHNHFVREAKNEEGDWVAAEQANDDYCTTGLNEFVIPAYQTAIAKLLRYNGNYKTTFRLRFKQGQTTIYSNEFSGSIDKAIIEQ